jgi:hypothetical protein
VAVLGVLAPAGPLEGQGWDFPARGAAALSEETGGKIKFSFEQRGRFEDRGGQAFGKDPDLASGYLRTRLGVALKPSKWVKFSAMMQDGRSPYYGAGAPNTVRDQADLQEAYVEVLGDAKTGPGLSVGRRMMNYGDARLLGSPQWSYLSRTFDHARLWYRSPRAQVEFLFVSPVKTRLGEFNKPVLGERVWGVYNVFPEVVGKNLLEVYVLRHGQNRPAGFKGGAGADGTDRLEVNAFGGRLAGPLAKTWKYTLELVVQTGSIGPAAHRAQAAALALSRKTRVGGKPLELTGEYKYASGSDDPNDPRRVSTFDQMFPANHDKFGHMDLFGWKNMHNARGLAVCGVTKPFALNAMYNSTWLANPRDALYSGAGKPIARSAAGTAGRHAGQEADVFLTYKFAHFLFGAGYGRLFAGGFIRKATKGVSPDYAYVFYTYSF